MLPPGSGCGGILWPLLVGKSRWEDGGANTGNWNLVTDLLRFSKLKKETMTSLKMSGMQLIYNKDHLNIPRDHYWTGHYKIDWSWWKRSGLHLLLRTIVSSKRKSLIVLTIVTRNNILVTMYWLNVSEEIFLLKQNLLCKNYQA